jgi:uncharacterized sporulation protein YeaH/YhbH (DUF444 family)
MPKRIIHDHNMFRDVVAGRTNEELKKHISTGQIFRRRGKDGFIGLPIPQINLPHIRYGGGDTGVGRGPGDKGDKVGEEPGKGNGQGGKPGEGASDGMIVNVDLRKIMQELKTELELPNIRKKTNETYEEIKIKYNGLSKVGPASLLHKRKTMLACMKRMASLGKLEETVFVPGLRQAIPILTPITDDKRYRQWNEIKIPSSNAVIFFARDISGSMDVFKCDIVNDIAWWIDCWIQCFYDKVQRCYVMHDTEAKEVDEKRFYKQRYGGGTLCSSAMQYISEQLKHRFPPEKWNVYVFYFSDGDNFPGDNEKFVKIIKEKMPPNVVNLVGVTEILPSPYSFGGTLKTHVDKCIGDNTLDNMFVRTAAVADTEKKNAGYYYWAQQMNEEARNQAIKNVLKELLGQKKQNFIPQAVA